MEEATHRARTATAIAFGLIALGTVWWTASAGSAQSPDPSQSPTTEPRYYVDGARPEPGADSFVESASERIPDGCVQWSSERPDVAICGTLPPGWQPPPSPGDETTYPEVCAAAEAEFNSQVPDLALRYDLKVAPNVDVTTCSVAGIGDASEGRWLVTFKLGSPEQLNGYRVAKIWDLRLDPGTPQATGALTASVTLSTSGGGA